MCKCSVPTTLTLPYPAEVGGGSLRSQKGPVGACSSQRHEQETLRGGPQRSGVPLLKGLCFHQPIARRATSTLRMSAQWLLHSLVMLYQVPSSQNAGTFLFRSDMRGVVVQILTRSVLFHRVLLVSCIYELSVLCVCVCVWSINANRFRQGSRTILEQGVVHSSFSCVLYLPEDCQPQTVITA